MARFSEVTRGLVLKKTDGKCYICKNMIDTSLPKTSARGYQVDHLVPLSVGGSNDISNLMPACGACNNKKKDFPVAVALRNAKKEMKTSRAW